MSKPLELQLESDNTGEVGVRLVGRLPRHIISTVPYEWDNSDGAKRLVGHVLHSPFVTVFRNCDLCGRRRKYKELHECDICDDVFL